MNGEPPDDDPVELWGRRIGRGLAIATACGLGLYLLAPYLFR